MEEDRLENAASLCVPLVSQDLNILACTLLDLNISVISVCLNDLSDLIRAASQADSEFRQSSQGPANNGITALSLAIMLIKDLFVHLNYVFLADGDRISVWPFRSAIDKHLTEFADEPASELDHAHLIDVLFHTEVDFGDAVLV